MSILLVIRGAETSTSGLRGCGFVGHFLRITIIHANDHTMKTVETR